MASQRARLLLGIVVIAAIVIVVARHGESYAQQAAAACFASYDDAGKPPPPGLAEAGYFSTVVVVAQARVAAMSVLEPPVEHAAVHREILEADAELARRARASVERLAIVGPQQLVQHDFPQLRAMEAAQKRRFEAIGVEDCSN